MPSNHIHTVLSLPIYQGVRYRPSMSPHEYRQARKDKRIHATIDECPYLPMMKASDEASIQDIVRQIVAHSNDKIDKDAASQAVSAPLSVKTVSGGITNTLYLVESGPAAANHAEGPASSPLQLLVRVFGAEGMIDRDVENATYAALSRAHIAPGYWGRFANGRVESWCPGMRPLAVSELAVHSSGIAVALATMHREFTVPESLQEFYQAPNLWTQLHEWLDQALKSKFQTEQDSRRAATLQLDQIETELQWLKDTQISADAQVCFCHNDLLAANILVDDSTGNSETTSASPTDSRPIQLIDFEYGGVNFCAFDIANHFNEYAGGPPDDAHPNYAWLPSLDCQKKFLTTYLQTLHNGKEPTAAQVQTLQTELHGFLLANHLYWGLWAVNQAATEGCTEFDYMEYAINRLKQYWVVKGGE